MSYKLKCELISIMRDRLYNDLNMNVKNDSYIIISKIKQPVYDATYNCIIPLMYDQLKEESNVGTP